MGKIQLHRLSPESAKVEQLRPTRDWMDASSGKHAYMCFPMTLVNGLGWGISFDKDIRVIWDGIEDSIPEHVKILEGEEIAYVGRGHSTVSFRTGIVINTDEDTTMLTMPVPNQFIRGVQTVTTLMSTSFFKAEFPIAIKLTEPNREVFIPAGTPVASILPISIGALQSDYEMVINEGNSFTDEYWDELRKYGEAAQEKNGIGDWSKMYRNALNYDGTSMGSHESKNIKLKTVTCPVTGATSEAAD